MSADESVLAQAPPARPSGRALTPSGFTPEIADALVEAAQFYPHVEAIAYACGVTPSLLLWWLQKGIDGDGEAFVDFARRFFQAEAKAFRAQVEKLEAELEGNPTTRLAYIKYRFGDGESSGTRPSEALSRLIRKRK